MDRKQNKCQLKGPKFTLAFLELTYLYTEIVELVSMYFLSAD